MSNFISCACLLNRTEPLYVWRQKYITKQAQIGDNDKIRRKIIIIKEQNQLLFQIIKSIKLFNIHQRAHDRRLMNILG